MISNRVVCTNSFSERIGPIKASGYDCAVGAVPCPDVPASAAGPAGNGVDRAATAVADGVVVVPLMDAVDRRFAVGEPQFCGNWGEYR